MGAHTLGQISTKESALPDGKLLDHAGVMDFFAKEFGFDPNETVALMGAHTLGQIKTNNQTENQDYWLEAAYEGIWTERGANDFNNQYYKALKDPSMSWTHNADKKISFTPGEGISFMLASDWHFIR